MTGQSPHAMALQLGVDGLLTWYAVALGGVFLLSYVTWRQRNGRTAILPAAQPGKIKPVKAKSKTQIKKLKRAG